MLPEHSPVLDPGEADHPVHNPYIPSHSNQEGKYGHKQLAEKNVCLREGAIVSNVQTLHRNHHTLGEMLEDIRFMFIAVLLVGSAVIFFIG